MTPEEREKKIKRLQALKDKSTDKKERDRLRVRIWDLKNWDRKMELARIRKQKKREAKAEHKQKSIAILKSKTAFELAYIKYTKEDNKKFFSTKNYYS